MDDSTWVDIGILPGSEVVFTIDPSPNPNLNPDVMSEGSGGFRSLINIPLGGTEGASNLHAQKNSLVLGVTMHGRIVIWLVDATHAEAYGAPEATLLSSPTYTGPAICAAAVPPLRQQPHLPIAMVGYADGSVRLYVLAIDKAEIIAYANSSLAGVEAGQPPEPLRRWSRFSVGSEPVLRVALESPTRGAVVVRDAWDVCQIFEADSSLTGSEREGDPNSNPIHNPDPDNHRF